MSKPNKKRRIIIVVCVIAVLCLSSVIGARLLTDRVFNPDAFQERQMQHNDAEFENNNEIIDEGKTEDDSEKPLGEEDKKGLLEVDKRADLPQGARGNNPNSNLNLSRGNADRAPANNSDAARAGAIGTANVADKGGIGIDPIITPSGDSDIITGVVPFEGDSTLPKAESSKRTDAETEEPWEGLRNKGHSRSKGGGGGSSSAGDNNTPTPTPAPAPADSTPTDTNTPADINAGGTGDASPTAPDDKTAADEGDDPITVLPQDLFGNTPSVPHEGISSGTAKSKDSGGRIAAITDNIFGSFENLYAGQRIDDWTLLCSMYLYYIDENEETYRIDELNEELFYFGEYPSEPQEDFDVDIFFRPNTDSEWLTTTAHFQLAECRVALKGFDGAFVAGISVNLGEEVTLYDRFNLIQTDTENKLDNLFLGWSESPEPKDGDIIYSFKYTPTKKGRTVLYPAALEKLGEEYTAQMMLNFEGGYSFTFLQTLTEYRGGEELNVPEGIQKVGIAAELDRVSLPVSVLYVDITALNVRESYAVDEENAEYSAYMGMLCDKSIATIYDIPDNMTSVTVPETVSRINTDYGSGLKSIRFTGSVPPAIELSNLDGAELIVPDEYYYSYLVEWSDSLCSNRLVSDSSKQDDYITDNGFIYSSDGSILYSVPNSQRGYIEISSAIGRIDSGAFQRSTCIETVIVPDSVGVIGDNCFNNETITTVVMKSSIPPQISADTFGDNQRVYVPEGLRDTYIESWAGVLGEEKCLALISNSSAYLTEENGFILLTSQEGNILLRADDSVTAFDENTLETEISYAAAYAFADNSAVKTINMPQSVKGVGMGCFESCTALELIVFNSADTFKVGMDAFEGCYNLRCAAANAAYADFGYYYPYLSAAYGPNGGEGYPWSWNTFDHDYYMTTEGSNALVYGHDTPNENNGYTECSFLRGACSDISGAITLADNTVEIGNYVFSGCANSFTLAEESLKSIKYIYDGAFQYSGYEGDTADFTSLCEIYSDAFNGCSGLRVSCLPEGLCSVGSRAFYGCNIEELILPPTVNSISYGAFEGMVSLKTLEFTSSEPPMLVTLGVDLEFSFGLNENTEIKLPEGMEQQYIDIWKVYSTGKDTASLTDEDLAAGEEIVRGWLKLSYSPEPEPSGGAEDVSTSGAAVEVYADINAGCDNDDKNAEIPVKEEAVCCGAKEQAAYQEMKGGDENDN